MPDEKRSDGAQSSKRKLGRYAQKGAFEILISGAAESLLQNFTDQKSSDLISRVLSHVKFETSDDSDSEDQKPTTSSNIKRKESTKSTQLRDGWF